MSYRIHLNIIDRVVFEEYMKTKENVLDFYRIRKESAELRKTLNIDKFKRLSDKESKFPEYILSKEDIKTILLFYKGFLIENAQNYLNQIAEVQNNLLSENYTAKKAEGAITLLDSFKVFNLMVECYFKDTDVETKESSLFLLDYFHILNIYRSFDENKEVAIITHG